MTREDKAEGVGEQGEPGCGPLRWRASERSEAAVRGPRRTEEEEAGAETRVCARLVALVVVLTLSSRFTAAAVWLWLLARL